MGSVSIKINCCLENCRFPSKNLRTKSYWRICILNEILPTQAEFNRSVCLLRKNSFSLCTDTALNIVRWKQDLIYFSLFEVTLSQTSAAAFWIPFQSASHRIPWSPVRKLVSACKILPSWWWEDIASMGQRLSMKYTCPYARRHTSQVRRVWHFHLISSYHATN